MSWRTSASRCSIPERPLLLDFHTMPQYGVESVLEKHWAGAKVETELVTFRTDKREKEALEVLALLLADTHPVEKLFAIRPPAEVGWSSKDSNLPLPWAM